MSSAQVSMGRDMPVEDWPVLADSKSGGRFPATAQRLDLSKAEVSVREMGHKRCCDGWRTKR